MLLAGISASTERLREAVPGLAGFAGFLLLPTLGAWGRVLLEMVEQDRASLGRRRYLSSRSMARAVGLAVLLLFFLFTTLRAAGDLRQIQLEAPVLGSSLRGFVVGLSFYVVYAAGFSLLRKGNQRRSFERRIRTLR